MSGAIARARRALGPRRIFLEGARVSVEGGHGVAELAG